MFFRFVSLIYFVPCTISLVINMYVIKKKISNKNKCKEHNHVKSKDIYNSIIGTMQYKY